MSDYNARDFYGSIVLKDWVRWHDGRSYIGFTGRVSIVQDEELVGFRAKGNESNWVARISGDTESVNILGCQIRAGVVHSIRAIAATGADYLLVP
jgi:hypothetical protein